jgi:hypothetical protein
MSHEEFKKLTCGGKAAMSAAAPTGRHDLVYVFSTNPIKEF